MIRGVTGLPGIGRTGTRLRYVAACNDTYRYGWRCVGEDEKPAGCSIPICWELGMASIQLIMQEYIMGKTLLVRKIVC